MSLFWAIVCAMALLSLMVLTVPLWRARVLTASTSTAAISVPIASLLLFAALGGAPPERDVHAVEASELLHALTQHVREHPDDITAWEHLGRAYFAMGQYVESAAAYEESWRRTLAPSVTLKLAYAEANLLSQRDSVAGLAGELIEQVLAEDPENSRALMYGGLAAELRGDNAIARERWQRLMAQKPPEQIANIVRERLAALDKTVVADPGAIVEEAE